MKTSTATLLIALTAVFYGCGGVGGSTGAAKPKVGDAVVYKTSPIVYTEGKVEKIDAGKYEIRSGGNIAKVDAGDVYPLPAANTGTAVKPGDVVVAFSRENHWAAGVVESVTDQVVQVNPVSGNKINAAHDKVLAVSPAAAADIQQSIEKKGFEDVAKAKRAVVLKDWKPKPGEKVAAQWSFGTWHVAVIKNVNKTNVDVDWQNGWSDGSVALDKIAPYPTEAGDMPAVGSHVIVRPQSDVQEWKFATVSAISGSEAEVRFADGRSQRVKRSDIIALA